MIKIYHIPVRQWFCQLVDPAVLKNGKPPWLYLAKRLSSCRSQLNPMAQAVPVFIRTLGRDAFGVTSNSTFLNAASVFPCSSLSKSNSAALIAGSSSEIPALNQTGFFSLYLAKWVHCRCVIASRMWPHLSSAIFVKHLVRASSITSAKRSHSTGRSRLEGVDVYAVILPCEGRIFLEWKCMGIDDVTCRCHYGVCEWELTRSLIPSHTN